MEMDRGKLPIVRWSGQNLAIVPVTSGGAPASRMALVAVVMAGGPPASSGSAQKALE
jgi:hypothetical protein